MGIYKFKFSNMIPNNWFYKLKDMRNRTKDTTNKIKTQSPKSTTTTHQPKNHHPQFFTNSRHSYYISTDSFKSEKLHNSPLNPKSNDTQFPPLNPARKSSKRRRRKNTKITKTTIKSPSLRFSTRISTSKNPSSPFENSSSDDLINDLCEFILTELESDPHSVSDPFESQSSWSSSCKFSSSATDIIIDMDDNDSSNQNLEKFNGFDLISELELPPILTKPRKFSNMVSGNRKKETKPVQFRTDPLSVKVVNGGTEKTNSKEQKMGMGNSYRRSTSSSRERIRSKSPKKTTRKTPKYSRKLGVSCIKKNSRSLEKKNVSDSFAVVKCSFDPQRDFRESMVEMILENNIRASKDLEELLACYLTLNSNEYHDLIVKVFEQIWFDLTNSKL